MDPAPVGLDRNRTRAVLAFGNGMIPPQADDLFFIDYGVGNILAKAEADAAKWDEQIGMMEMVLNVDALADAVRKMREANSKYPL